MSDLRKAIQRRINQYAPPSEAVNSTAHAVSKKASLTWLLLRAGAIYTTKGKAAMSKWMMERLQEPSTWRGIVAFVAGTGVLGAQVSPELTNAIVGVGLAVIGLLGILTRDKSGKGAK